MNLLVDENLPPRLAVLLTEVGYNAVHVRDLGAAGASDPRIVELALDQQRVIVSADTDFGALLAQANDIAPSVVLVREVIHLRPDDLADLLARYLDQLNATLNRGAMVAITPRGGTSTAAPAPLIRVNRRRWGDVGEHGSGHAHR